MAADLGTPVFNGTTDGTLLSVSRTVTVAAGDSILIGVTYANGQTGLAVTCPGKTVTLIVAQADATNDQDFAVYKIENPGAGTYTITLAVTTGGGGAGQGWLDIAAIPVTGCITSTIEVGNSANTQASPGTGANAVTSGTAITPSAYPVIAVGFSQVTDSSETPAVGTGWTNVGTGFGFGGGTDGLRIEKKYVTSGTVQATFTSASGTKRNSTIVVALREAAGPTITSQPVTAHVAIGATASFSVTAATSGGGTITAYQWKLNGTNVSTGSGGTTASYTTAALALADDGGSYTCEVTETGGSNDGTKASSAALARVGVLLVASSTAVYTGTGTPTTIAPTWPTTAIAAGDVGKVVLVIGMKPATSGAGTVTTPAGWTLVGNIQAAGGYTGGSASLADAGNCDLYVYSIDDPGTITGSVTVTLNVGATNGVAWATMHRYSAPSGAAFALALATGSDTSAGSVSLAFATDPGVALGDRILAAMCIPTDVTTPAQFSAQAFTQTGVTFGTVTEIQEPDTGNNFDLGGFLVDAVATAGPSSAAPTMTATAGGTTTNVRGPGTFLRLRADVASTGAGAVLDLDLPPVAPRAPTQPTLVQGFGQATPIPAGKAMQVQPPRAVPLAQQQPSLVVGFGQAAAAPAGQALQVQPPRVAPVIQLQPSLLAGFGQAAVAAAAAAILSVAPAPVAARTLLPTQPTLLAGVAQAAPAPAGTILTSSLPARNDFAGVMLITGIGVPDPEIGVLQTQTAPVARQLPALPQVLTGVVPAVAAPTASVLQVKLPPGIGLPLPPTLFQGFGQAAQNPTLTQALPPAAVPKAPLAPQLIVGFGQAAQVPVIVTSRLPDAAPTVPAAPSLLAGVVPIAVSPAGTVVQVALPLEQDLPPRPLLLQGFGQPSVDPAGSALAVTLPVTRDLLVRPQLIAGFGQPVVVPAGAALTVSLAPDQKLPPKVQVLQGFGQAAQVAVLLRTALAPTVSFPPRPTLAAGVVPPIPPIAVVLQVPPPPLRELPPRAQILIGFGTAAQVAAVVRAAELPPSVKLAPVPALFSGVTVPPIPLAPMMALAPQYPRALPPPSTLIAGSLANAIVPLSPIAAVTLAPFAKLPPQAVIVMGFGQATPPESSFSGPVFGSNVLGDTDAEAEVLGDADASAEVLGDVSARAEVR